MKEISRILHLWRYAFLGVRMELLLFYLVLLWYAVTPLFLQMRAFGRMEEILQPCLMAAMAWLAGRIMLTDPLGRLRASWRVMPWTAREMAWGRAAFVPTAVFLPWLAAHAARLLMLRPDTGVFLSAMANPMGFWPVVALSALAAGLSRSLLMWLLTPVAAMGVITLLVPMADHFAISRMISSRSLSGHDLPWPVMNLWYVQRSNHLIIGIGALCTLAGLILLGWPKVRRGGWALILAFLLALSLSSIPSWENPPLAVLERITFPADSGVPHAAVYDGVAGLQEGEFLEIRGFERKFQPEHGQGEGLKTGSAGNPHGLVAMLRQSSPGALQVGSWGNMPMSALWINQSNNRESEQPVPLKQGAGVLDIKALYDVCRMELLADWPLNIGEESFALGHRLQLESLKEDGQSVTVSVVMEGAETLGGNFLREHRTPGNLVFVLVMTDGTMVMTAESNKGYISRNFFNGRSVRAFGLKWSGILTDPWQSGAARDWMEGCRLKIYTNAAHGIAVQRINRRVEQFP